MAGNDGKTYVGKFMELFCNSYNFSSLSTGILEYKGMWDEDPDYNPWQGIESIEAGEGTDKVLIDGALYIVREGAVYNVTGMRVK